MDAVQCLIVLYMCVIVGVKDVDKGGGGGGGGAKAPPVFLHALIMADLLEVSTCTPVYVE